MLGSCLLGVWRKVVPHSRQAAVAELPARMVSGHGLASGNTKPQFQCSLVTIMSFTVLNLSSHAKVE